MKFSEFLFSRPLFNEKRSAWVEHIPFAFYIMEMLKPDMFVELGAHYGNSYFAFCQAIYELKLNTKTFAVDTWIGDEHAGLYNEEVYDYVQKGNSKHFSEFSRLLRMSFDDASKQCKDGSIDLLHIDGMHTYEAVKHDFETWLPKLSPKGVVILHDTQEIKNDFGVWKLMSELRNQYPCCELYHGHGLGVICVGIETNREVVGFVNYCNSDSFAQSLFATLGRLTSLQNTWFLRRSKGKQLSPRYAQLFFREQGNDFESNPGMVHNISGNESKLIFRFNEEQTITRLNFFPLNQIIQLRLHNICFYYQGQELELSYSVSSNALFIDNQVYLIESDQSGINISFTGGASYLFSEVVFDVEYMEENIEDIKMVLQHRDQLKK